MGIRELNIDLTDEHIALRDAARKFCGEVWRPAAIALDKLPDPQDVIAEGSVLWGVFRKTWAMGYHRMPFLKEFGGLEMDPLSGALVSEEMGWAAPDLAVSWAVCTTPFIYAQYSPDPEISALARKFCADTKAEMTGCWAITEPDHGSDWIHFEGEFAKDPRVAPQVRAVLEGDHYVINGQKSAWVSNGTFAKYAALWLSLDPSRGMEVGGIAIVPLNLPGVSRGKPLNKIGQRALNQGEIFFDNVRIPKNMMVVSDPATFKFMTNAQLGMANGWMGLCFAGTAQAALEEALAYSKTRVQGGKLIYNHQSVKQRLFDMFVSVEAARSLARRVAIYNSALVRQMQPAAVHYGMAAKILSTETAFRVASEAVQMHGGYGLSKEYFIEKVFRDARAAMIEDGNNEVLALGGADRLLSGKIRGVVFKGAAPVARAQGGPTQEDLWEKLKPMFRPEPGTVHMGVMKVDAQKCSSCGLCIENCPFRAWEMGEKKNPQLKEGYDCFSCFNCMAACPTRAISIVDVYHVDKGFFVTDPQPLPVKMPSEPKDAQGKPGQWTVIEQALFERRSVRNFKDEPVPEHLIRRVLEAGRFAPSSGNCQPWKFIVITDKAFIKQLNEACYAVINMFYNTYKNDAMVKALIPLYTTTPQSGLFDPRVILGGMGSIAKKNAPLFLNAPVVILIACDDRSIGGPQIQAGICGQNMGLAAKSLGLGSCWIGFSQVIEMVPPLKEKLGLKEPWKVNNAIVLGYPKFKQEGVVPREFRPYTWFREGTAGPEFEG